MRRTVVVISIVLALLVTVLGCIPLAPPEPSPSPQQTPPPATAPSPAVVERTQATVISVIDGDTIDVNISGSVYRVRYIGIDTPERGQVGYDEATLANAQLVSNRVVELEKDVSETDKYGRLLRYVWVKEGMVNAILVASGYAQESPYPPDVKYQAGFFELQSQAREAGWGLWALEEEAPITPATSQPSGAYVGSVNGDVYHYPDCSYVEQIYHQNRIWFSSPADARAHGYRPGKVCRPP